jgi:hypothetical protein
MWRAVNDVAAAVHELDPHHPTLVVTAEVGEANQERLARYCPQVDVWGINSYDGLASLPSRLDARGYDGPYVVTEHPAAPSATRRSGGA